MRIRMLNLGPVWVVWSGTHYLCLSLTLFGRHYYARVIDR